MTIDVTTMFAASVFFIMEKVVTMHTQQNFSSNINSFNQSSSYLERPRLQTLLEGAMSYPLVVACAGAGYGKTRAIYSFLQKYQAQTTWVQLSERDNSATRFWENCMYVISQHLPDVAARFLEIGFPQSEAAFAKFDAIIQEALSTLPPRHVIVFDDFHLLQNPVVLDFLERAIDSFRPAVTTILISRTMPKIDIIGFMMHERVFTINEDMLRFTEDEIAEYLKQLALSVTRQDVRNIYDDTQGWAFAVNLIGRSLHKNMKYERSALEAMKANISRLIEKEVAPIVSTPFWRFLLRISLIDNLAVSFIKTLDDTLFPEEVLASEMERLSAFIHCDFQLGSYAIHHLFLEYLHKNQHLLTDEEKRETYQKAAVWCDINGYHMDAFSYYEKSGDYKAIVRKVAMLSMQMSEIVRYALAIFDRAPESAVMQNPIFYAMYLKLKTSLGQLDEALALAERYVETFKAQPPSPQRNHTLSAIYAIWGILRMLECTYTDAYDFDVYFQKMSECYDKDPFALIGSYTDIFVSTWASLVGVSRASAQDEYLQAVCRAIPHVSHVLNGNMSGFDDLVRGELAYYRYEMDIAQQYFKQSIDKARPNNQYVTHHNALFYLMKIAFFRGDMDAAASLLHTMESLLSDKDYDPRYTAMYDVVCGFFHLMLNQAEQIPEWLKGDFSAYAHSVFLENHANRVKVLYHYHTRQYNSLVIFIESALQQHMILFGRIELLVFKALSLYHLKRRDEAIQAFVEAYHLAEPNNITLPFIRHSNDMRALTAAALKYGGCRIPGAWLESINRKASTYSKRKSQMISAHRLAGQTGQMPALSNRETAVLKDLSQGLSRTEIAVNQNLSVNTVKMVINHIYNKLGANSLAEAIRVAAERKII